MKRWAWIGIALLVTVVFCFSAVAAEIKVINPKAAFPEGPVWLDGKLYYVEYGAGVINTWDGTRNVKFWEQEGCGPSAVIPFGEGDFLVTCYDANTVVRVSSDGQTKETYDKDRNGKGFVGPNDFAADKRGGVYFTASGPWESAPIEGKIYYIDPTGTITEAANDVHYANGLALSLDGKTLYCAESEAGRVIQFTVGPDGALSQRRLFVRVGQVDPDSGAYAYPDGLKMDSKGNLFIGQYSKGRIVVVSPEGKLVKTIDVPSTTAPNLNFGPDEKVIYVMAVDDVNNSPYYGKVYEVPNK